MKHTIFRATLLHSLSKKYVVQGHWKLHILNILKKNMFKSNLLEIMADNENDTHFNWKS